MRWPRVILTFLLFLTFVSSFSAAGFFYWQNRQLRAADRELENTQNRVAKLMQLPEETPVLATVSDKEKLTAQPFFKNAENGDKVLIYSEAAKAILYRPSENKIIEVAPLNINPEGQSNTQTQTDTSTTPQASASPEPQEALPTVSLYNGSQRAGLTNQVEASLKQAYPNLQVLGRSNAAKTDYTSTFVIDLSGTNRSFAQELAAHINGEVSTTLPEGEVNPNADILVIVGNNF